MVVVLFNWGVGSWQQFNSIFCAVAATCRNNSGGWFQDQSMSQCRLFNGLNVSNWTGSSCFEISIIFFSVGFFHKCSVTCGKGEKRRSIHCNRGNQIVASEQCDLSVKPSTLMTCKMTECPEWREEDWGPVSKFDLCVGYQSTSPQPNLLGIFYQVLNFITLRSSSSAFLNARQWSQILNIYTSDQPISCLPQFGCCLVPMLNWIAK